MAQTIMPAAFIGHGSPMNTLERNRFTTAWGELGRRLPRPRAVLCISAHWLIKSTAVTAMAQPRVIHDFYGFPRELSEFDYPAPGAPEIAHEVADLLKPHYVGLDLDSWGLDHGTWSVLTHVFPRADVPVLQLSLHAQQPPHYHTELGRALAPLRERGVFILGSGNVVHNLRLMARSHNDSGYEWCERFDAEVQRIMTTSPRDLIGITDHADYALSVPTPEHFLPLYYLAGLCDAAGEPAHPFAAGGVMGSLSMTSYVHGMPELAHQLSGRTGAVLPSPVTVPADQTNL